MVSVIIGEPEHTRRTSSGNCEVVAVAASSLRLSINTNPCNDGTVLLESFSPQPAAGHDLIGELPFVFFLFQAQLTLGCCSHYVTDKFRMDQIETAKCRGSRMRLLPSSPVMAMLVILCVASTCRRGDRQVTS